MACRTRKASKPKRIDTHVEWKLLYLPRPPEGNGRRPVSTPSQVEVQEVENPTAEREVAGQS